MKVILGAQVLGRDVAVVGAMHVGPHTSMRAPPLEVIGSLRLQADVASTG